MAKALRRYEEKNDMEISFGEGDIVSVIEKSDTGIWRGKINGKVGTFPASHVEVIAGAEFFSSFPLKSFCNELYEAHAIIPRISRYAVDFNSPHHRPAEISITVQAPCYVCRHCKEPFTTGVL